MGNCCAGSSNDGEVNMYNMPTTKQTAYHIFDNREVLGLRGTDKLILLVKL